MSEYTAHALDGHALAESQCRKAVPCAVEGDVLCDTALADDFLEPLADRPVVDVPEYGVVSLIRSVSFDDLQGDIKQFHLKRNLCFVSFRKYPFLAVHLHDLIGGEFFQVHERKGSEGGENEQVTHEGGVAVGKLVSHKFFQFVLREELTLLRVRAYMELRERVSRYLAVEVRTHHHTLEPHAVQPNRGVPVSFHRTEVHGEVPDEVGSEFEHGYVAAVVLVADKLFRVVPCPEHHLVCSHAPVLAHTLEQGGAVPVKGFEQGVILAAQPLIGVAHHFRGDERLTVGTPLVVPDDLRLDVVKREIGCDGFLALAFRPVAPHIPQLPRDGALAAELCHRAVDCYTPHDGDDTVFLLAAVHIEQHLECASCHCLFFLVAKLNMKEPNPAMQNMEQQSNSNGCTENRCFSPFWWRWLPCFRVTI